MRKLTSFLVVFSLLLSFVSVYASAYDLNLPEITEKISDYDRFGEGEIPVLSDNIQSYFYAFNNQKTNYTAYSLLDSCQKKMYDYIINASPGALAITFSFNNGEFLGTNLTQDYLSEVMYAVLRDHPEIFYFNGYSITGGYYYQGGTYIKEVNFLMRLKSTSTYSESVLPGYCSALESAVEKIKVDTSNRYNFVESVHDYLCSNIYYPDMNTTDYTGNAHDAYGALVEGKSVCEGYAEAFKLICNYYKIPCVCLTGEGVTSAGSGPHMWNAVQMDDGKWYLIDATWDDQETHTYYDFFLSGTDTVCSYGFGGNEFDESHINDENLFIPTLHYSTEAYAETNHNTLFKATYNSLAKEEGNYLIRSFFDADESYVYYNGMYVETSNLTTNDRFKVLNNENSVEEDWTLVLLGDCNGDGECNVLDYSAAVNNIIAEDETTDAYDLAMDIDCDGYLDVIDLALVQLLANGFVTDIEIE